MKALPRIVLSIETGGFTNAGRNAGMDRLWEKNLAEQLKVVDQQIEQQAKLAAAFNVSAAAAAEIKRELEFAAKMKSEFEGKVSTEGLEQLKAKYKEVQEQKDLLAAGPRAAWWRGIRRSAALHAPRRQWAGDPPDLVILE